MNQLTHYELDRKLVLARQEDLLMGGHNHGIESVHDRGIILRAIGNSLIRLGESLRGRTATARIPEVDRMIARKLAS
jgi:hypothetical protein